jgi:hypothetical protein
VHTELLEIRVVSLAVHDVDSTLKRQLNRENARSTYCVDYRWHGRVGLITR